MIFFVCNIRQAPIIEVIVSYRRRLRRLPHDSKAIGRNSVMIVVCNLEFCYRQWCIGRHAHDVHRRPINVFILAMNRKLVPFVLNQSGYSDGGTIFVVITWLFPTIWILNFKGRVRTNQNQSSVYDNGARRVCGHFSVLDFVLVG